MKDNTTSIHVKITYDDWLVTEDKIPQYIEGLRTQLSEVLSIEIGQIVIEKIVQEQPIWLDPSFETAEA